MRRLLIWSGLAAAVLIPLILAAQSPLLAYRTPVYIFAGFAGIMGLTLLLVQPLLALGALELPPHLARMVHRYSGGLLLACVVLHVAALWITSPPDVVDALLFRSPTPFSIWGVIAMVAVFSAALVAFLRLRNWRKLHAVLAAIIVTTTILHALQIDGTMEWWSKLALCALVALATLAALRTRRKWAR